MEDNKKYFLIYFDPTKDRNILKERVAKLGDRVYMDETLYIVKTELTAQEIYARFIVPPFEDANMELFITQLHPEDGQTFGSWGADLWRFLGLYSDEQPAVEETPVEENKEP